MHHFAGFIMSEKKMGPFIFIALTAHHTLHYCPVTAPHIFVWDYLLNSIYYFVYLYDHLLILSSRGLT